MYSARSPPPLGGEGMGEGESDKVRALRWSGAVTPSPQPLSPGGEGLWWSLQTRRHKLPERVGAVAHRILLCRIEFGKALVAAQRHEDRVIAEADIAARRPGQRAGNA